jgi:hypothetical protein
MQAGVFAFHQAQQRCHRQDAGHINQLQPALRFRPGNIGDRNDE